MWHGKESLGAQKGTLGQLRALWVLPPFLSQSQCKGASGPLGEAEEEEFSCWPSPVPPPCSLPTQAPFGCLPCPIDGRSSRGILATGFSPHMFPFAGPAVEAASRTLPTPLTFPLDTDVMIGAGHVCVRTLRQTVFPLRDSKGQLSQPLINIVRDVVGFLLLGILCGETAKLKKPAKDGPLFAPRRPESAT